MKSKRLNSKNKILTPTSGTTVYIDYSEEKKILEVEFRGGKTYHYYEVGLEIWKAYNDIVESGGSSGRFVNFEIKPNFRYDEIK